MCCSNKHELKLHKSNLVRSCNMPSDVLYGSVKVKHNNNNNNNNAVLQPVTLCYSLLDGYKIFRVTTVSFHTDLFLTTCIRFTFITCFLYVLAIFR